MDNLKNSRDTLKLGKAAETVAVTAISEAIAAKSVLCGQAASWNSSIRDTL